MNFNRGREDQDQFQIAPLIDIVFLLLVFFIATYSMAEIERELSVDLPSAESADTAESRMNEIVINIRANGEIVVNQRAMTLKQLEERLKRLASFGSVPGVILRADAESQHKYVVAVMDVCARRNVRHIFFATSGQREAGSHADE